MSVDQNRTPDWLFCIGAQKAGTTWLYDYLLSHPQVHVPPVKEMHYFNVLWDGRQSGFARQRQEALAEMTSLEGGALGAAARKLFAGWRAKAKDLQAVGALPGEIDSIETLRALVEMHGAEDPDHSAYRRFMLAGAEGARIVADVTPDYSTLGGKALEQIQESFANARFLFILRDPVERTWSNIKMHRDWMAARGMEDLSIDELMARIVAGRQKHILARSNYRGTVLALNTTVPEDRRLYLFYETMFSDDAMARLCDFMGVDFHPGDYGKRVRGGSETDMTEEQRLVLRSLLAPVYRGMKGVFRDALPESWDHEAARVAPGAIEGTAIARRAEELVKEGALMAEARKAEQLEAARQDETGGAV